MSKSMQHTVKAAVVALALLGAAAASATSVFTPLNGSLIGTTITNDSGTMSMIRFDLSNTVTMDGSQAVFGGLYGAAGFTPAGGSTYALVGGAGATPGGRERKIDSVSSGERTRNSPNHGGNFMG